ncbi:MAG: CBS domain-containing protein [Microgenomates group bacterium]|nr:CBS domain-containing protein [Microgenomates group bacterium]
MLYFSEVVGKKVETEDGIEIGRVEDLIFLVEEAPLISKIVIRTKDRQKLIIPFNFIKKINRVLIIKKNYLIENIGENEMSVLKNLLDKQIIDLKGNKIVRVNDVSFQFKDNNLYLIGVDIGILGIFRQLKLEDLFLKIANFFGIKIKSDFLSWGEIQPLELTHGHIMTKLKEEKLAKIKPEDLAFYLEKTNIENARNFLKMLNEKSAAKIIEGLNLNYQSDLFRRLKSDEIAAFLNYIDPDEAVDILLTLNPKKREEIIKKLSTEKQKEILKLIGLSKTSIGEIMSVEFIAVKPENTVGEVVQMIKKKAIDFSYLTTIYVINDKEELVGVFSLHELLLQELTTPVYRFMIQNLVVIHLTSPKEIVLKKMLKYNLQVLPVVDDQKRLLGVVTIDDLKDIILAKLG